MSESIARYYRADKQSGGEMFPGVPLRDISESEWAALPPHVQADVDASALYQKSKPPSVAPTRGPRAADEKEAT